jgi:hypothetical protein
MGYTHHKGISLTDDGLAYGAAGSESVVFGAAYNGSATWDPGNIADGDEEATTITVTGAALGDFVLVSFSLDIADLVLSGAVTAADTVTAVLANNTGAGVDLASGTVYARVLSRT